MVYLYLVSCKFSGFGQLLFFFIRKSHQHAGIKRLSFFVVAGFTAIYVIKKSRPNILSYFVVDRPGPEYGLPVAVIRNYD